MANNHANNNFWTQKMDKWWQKAFSIAFNFMDLFYKVFKKTLQFNAGLPEPSALISMTMSFN